MIERGTNVKNKDDQKPGSKETVQAENAAAQGPSAGDQVCLPRGEYESTLARLKELEGLKEQLLRSAADFDNAKKRLAKEREEFVKFGQENLIRELLPILDNFDRALFHADESANLAGVVKGIQMVLKKLQDTLQGEGLKRVPAVGEKFDPHLHEAVGYVHEDGPEDVIVEELEAGYKLHDRLLRPAKVRVRMSPASRVNGGGSSGEGDKQDELT